jgi:ribosomal protein L32
MTKAETTALVALAHAAAVPTKRPRTRATREQRLEARVTALEAELANATHSLGELRLPHHDPSAQPTTVIDTTTDGATLAKAKD